MCTFKAIPVQALTVEGGSSYQAHESGNVVSPIHRPPLAFRNEKFQLPKSGIEPAIFLPQSTSPPRT